MDVCTGLAPRALKRAMVMQRLEIPEDTDAVDRLFYYLDHARPTMAEIKQVICDFYLIKRDELEGESCKRSVTFARQVFCYLSYRYARTSLNAIRLRVGYADHTTAWHGVRRIEQYAITRPLVADDLDLLRLRICEKLLMRPNGSAQC
jgi:chromosomal replication initiation ATPase DnaA